MTWEAFHRRGEVLRRVIEVANERCDGRLPNDVAGVDAVFTDDVDLLGALQLRWHTALAGQIEASLADQPIDLPGAVVAAWRVTAADLPGVRAILDAHGEQPTSPEVAHVMETASAKERQMLALMAGLASRLDLDEQAARRGERLEREARAGVRLAAIDVPQPRGFLERLKAALAA
ncbi:hypothetical protein NODU109028_07805 [Nocardioides dubius]|uniref:DUF222 domain-containing protein n=1 Tax=Nocardioides dubius TaxID=317019 RepID=A0ABN1U009_9ACTN